MALTLTVDLAAWRANIDAVRAEHPDLVPVIKGNGYGFGRTRLAAEVADWGMDELAVGTVHELDTAGWASDAPRSLVLTPALTDELPVRHDAVLTVGRIEHVAAMLRARATNAVIVKLASSMRRYGVEPVALSTLLEAVAAAGLAVHGFGVHLPTAKPSAANAAEIEAWLPHLPAGALLYLSHIDATTEAALAAAHPGVRLRSRIGTRLWHGSKEFLHLGADVLEVRAVRAGERAGYRQSATPADGNLVMIGAGTAHGVHPLPDGRSPIHHHGRRLELHENPHMHTTVAFVPAGQPVPTVGESVDVQRPLTFVRPDVILER